MAAVGRGHKRHNIAQKVIAEHEAVLTEEDARDQVLLDVDTPVPASCAKPEYSLPWRRALETRNKKGFAIRLMITHSTQFC